MEPTASLAANMLAAYSSPILKNSSLEDSVSLVASNYRHLKPQVEQLSEEYRPEWETMLTINSCFEEAFILLNQAENLTLRPALPGISPISPFNDQHASLLERLQKIRHRILGLKTEHTHDFKKIENQGMQNAAIQNLLNEQQRILTRIHDTLRLNEPQVSAPRIREESNPEKTNVFERVWSHPFFCKPIAVAGGAMEVARQVLAERQGKRSQLFRLKLSASILNLFYALPDTVYAMVQIVKEMKESGTLRKELKAGQSQLTQLQIRLENIQQELIYQRITDQSTPSYWAERLSQERDALMVEEQVLKAKLVEMQEELRTAPMMTSLSICGILGSLAEISANVLEMVNTFFEVGSYISENVLASIGTAIQFLAPIAGGIQLLLGGGMLAVQSKKMYDLNRTNRKLKQQIADAEAQMHPFNELEVKRLKLALLKNNRKLGLMGLGISNSTLLTVGGIIGLASALTSFAFPVSIALAGISLGILGVSLGLSIAKMIHKKRSAKLLELQQYPLRVNSQELAYKAERLVAQFKCADLSSEARTELLRIWDILCARDSKLATLASAKAAMQDPKILKEAFANYFSEIVA